MAGGESDAHLPSKSAKFQHYLNRLADQLSGKTTQHHDDKYTFLVVKPQNSGIVVPTLKWFILLS